MVDKIRDIDEILKEFKFEIPRSERLIVGQLLEIHEFLKKILEDNGIIQKQNQNQQEEENKNQEIKPPPTFSQQD